MKVRAGFRVRGQGSHAHRQPEVDQLDRVWVLGAQHHVLELDVPVHDPPRVAVQQPLDDAFEVGRHRAWVAWRIAVSL